MPTSSQYEPALMRFFSDIGKNVGGKKYFPLKRDFGYGSLTVLPDCLAFLRKTGERSMRNRVVFRILILLMTSVLAGANLPGPAHYSYGVEERSVCVIIMGRIALLRQFVRILSKYTWLRHALVLGENSYAST